MSNTFIYIYIKRDYDKEFQISKILPIKFPIKSSHGIETILKYNDKMLHYSDLGLNLSYNFMLNLNSKDKEKNDQDIISIDDISYITLSKKEIVNNKKEIID